MKENKNNLKNMEMIFCFEKKIKKYCETNNIPCPHTNAKKHNWFNAENKKEHKEYIKKNGINP